MRLRLVLVFLAVSTLVATAFVLPLGFLVRRTAEDRAVDAARADAAAVVPALVADGTRSQVEAAVGTTGSGRDGRMTVLTAQGWTIGAEIEPSDRVEAALASGTSDIDDTAGGIEVVAAVASGPDELSAIRVFVPDSELRSGQWRAWGALAGVGVVLVGISVVVADLLARTVVRPTQDLASAHGRQRVLISISPDPAGGGEQLGSAEPRGDLVLGERAGEGDAVVDAEPGGLGFEGGSLVAVAHQHAVNVGVLGGERSDCIEQEIEPLLLDESSDPQDEPCVAGRGGRGRVLGAEAVVDPDYASAGAVEPASQELEVGITNGDQRSCVGSDECREVPVDSVAVDVLGVRSHRIWKPGQQVNQVGRVGSHGEKVRVEVVDAVELGRLGDLDRLENESSAPVGGQPIDEVQDIGETFGSQTGERPELVEEGRFVGVGDVAHESLHRCDRRVEPAVGCVTQ